MSQDKERKLSVRDELTDFLLYSTGEGQMKVEVFLHEENVWLTINQMAELFGKDKSGISRHLKNIFESGELEKNSVVANFATTAADGKTYQVDYYSLDAIISVGYRVNSTKATQFRIWATKVLKEYIIKGFAMDDDRLKNGRHFGKDYFRELLERVRSIRASERRIYQQITDIFAECSIDYNPKSETTRNFSLMYRTSFTLL
ncbi:MAG: virulence RhuM family protein [Lentisphaeraceae bacterium]|nr:virulence RhuM family protein [Lentisphaeraceae bacterium]